MLLLKCLVLCGELQFLVSFVRIAQALLGACGTTATLGHHSEVAAQILERLGTFSGGLVYLAFGYC